MLNPFALPVHPLVVHFALAMLTAAWVCVIVRHATGKRVWEARLRLFEVIGVVALVPTIIAGFIDTRGFAFVIEPRFDAPLIWHMLAGLVAAAAFTAHFFLRRRSGGLHAAPDVGLATIGMLALVASGLLAGEMVYGT